VLNYDGSLSRATGIELNGKYTWELKVSDATMVENNILVS